MKKYLALSLILLTPTTFAASNYIYKYKDATGNYVYADKLPANEKGEFSLLSTQSGTIKKVIEKELNEDEIKIRDEKVLAEKEVNERSTTQKKRDVALLSTYSNADEIEKMKQYELNQIQQGIKNNTDTLNILKQKFNQMDANRKANPNNKQLQSDFEKIENDVNLAQQTLDSNKELLEQRTKKYDEDKERYLEILGEVGNTKK